MDFDALDLRQAADKEYWLHLRLGENYLYADMEKQEGPCRVQVASPASDGVESKLKAVVRAGERQASLSNQLASAVNREQRQAFEKRLDASEKEAERAIKDFLTAAIRDWENIEKGGEKLDFSKDALSDMTEPKAPLARLALTIAQDMGKLHDPFTKADEGS